MYKIDKSLYYLLDGYQRGLLLSDLQRIFKDKDFSFIYLYLSIPVRNIQILNEFKGDDRIGPIIAKFHDISCRTEIPKLISGEFISECVKSNIDVINEFNIHHHKLGDLDYEPCPEIIQL